MSSEPATLRFCALIPCLDGGDTLEPVVRGASEHAETVIVVDDGSSDGSAERARGLGADVVVHPRNRGKGAALITGLERAAALGFTHCVTIDADGQHAPADIPLLVRAAGQNPDAIVIGARDFAVDNVPGSSRFGRKFSNFWVRLETFNKLSDTQSGFRVYPVALVRALSVPASRFQWEVEVLVRGAWSGLPIVEIPVSVYYAPPDERISHYRGWADSALITRMHLRLLVRMLLIPFWRPPKLIPRRR